MPQSAASPAPRTADPLGRSAVVWFPWLCAPAFLLLPIAGCGVAAAIGRPESTATTAKTPAVSPPLVPITSVVTVLPARR
jgi:hypothetical protein